MLLRTFSKTSWGGGVHGLISCYFVCVLFVRVKNELVGFFGVHSVFLEFTTRYCTDFTTKMVEVNSSTKR